MKSYLVVIVFGIMLSLGMFHQWTLMNEVERLDDKVVQFINQDIEVEYNYFLWLHERELQLGEAEMTIYTKLKQYYVLPLEVEVVE